MRHTIAFIIAAAAFAVRGAVYTTLAHEDARETNTLATVDTRIATATNDLTTVLRSEIASAQPGNYATVSNIALTVGAITNLEPSLSSNFNPDYGTGYVELNGRIKVKTGISEYSFTDDGLLVDGTNGHDVWIGSDGDGAWVKLTSNEYENHWMTINGAHVATTNDTATLATTLRSEIAAAQPGNYAAVSNAAMTALQSYTETDPTVPAWAKASTKPSYTASEIGAYTTQEVDEAIAAAEPGDYATVSNAAVTAAAGVSELETTASLIYTLYAGSNVVFEVTNYDSQVHMPTARLLSLTATNTYDVVWTETNGLVTVAKAATNYTDAAILAATNRYALRGWSATTSGLGADAPAETTWVSTPTFVIAGGFEYEKVVTTAGEVWVLTSNGMTMATNGLGWFDISSSDGESIFRIEKTDSYTVGADADNITVSGNTVTISVPVVSASHPYLQYAATLNGTWYDELEGTLPNTISAAWSGSSGAWVCTVTTTATSGFFSFYYSQEGSTKIINNGMTDLSGGIYYNGVKYVPTVSGSELKFIAE